MKINFYVSDHGYGHATRSIAVIKALVAEGRGQVRVEVVNHHAYDLLTRALAGVPGVRVRDTRLDVGFVCREDSLAFDVGRTAMNVWNWISGWKQFVSEECERLRSSVPDLVVSDAAPEPLLVAERLGAPSVVTSNFTWVDQYEPHLRADLVAPLRGSYALAARGHAYSMRTALAGMRNVVPAGLVTREPSLPSGEVRARLGVPPDVPLIHLGFGWSADAVAAAQDLDPESLPREARLLVSANLASPAARERSGERLVTIPPLETEAHEFIASCDLAIVKAGYGTVAEAMAGKVPILAVPVEGSRESETIARTVAQLGIGAVYSFEEPLESGLFREGARMLATLDRYHDAYRRLPAEYAPGAAARLARSLLTSPELTGESP